MGESAKRHSLGQIQEQNEAHYEEEKKKGKNENERIATAAKN